MLSAKHILIYIAMLLAIVAMIFPNNIILGAAVLLLAVSNLVP